MLPLSEDTSILVLPPTGFILYYETTVCPSIVMLEPLHMALVTPAKIAWLGCDAVDLLLSYFDYVIVFPCDEVRDYFFTSSCFLVHLVLMLMLDVVFCAVNWKFHVTLDAGIFLVSCMVLWWDEQYVVRCIQFQQCVICLLHSMCGDELIFDGFNSFLCFHLHCAYFHQFVRFVSSVKWNTSLLNPVIIVLWYSYVLVKFWLYINSGIHGSPPVVAPTCVLMLTHFVLVIGCSLRAVNSGGIRIGSLGFSWPPWR